MLCQAVMSTPVYRMPTFLTDGVPNPNMSLQFLDAVKLVYGDYICRILKYYYTQISQTYIVLMLFSQVSMAKRVLFHYAVKAALTNQPIRDQHFPREVSQWIWRTKWVT